MVRCALLHACKMIIVELCVTGKRDTLPASHPLVVARDDTLIDAANDERLFVCTVFILMRYCLLTL